MRPWVDLNWANCEAASSAAVETMREAKAKHFMVVVVVVVVVAGGVRGAWVKKRRRVKGWVVG